MIWVIISCFFSNAGDLAVKAVRYLPSAQIAWMRVTIGTALLLPWAFTHRNALQFKYPSLQIGRVIASFSAVWLWSFGASHSSMMAITSIAFLCPVLVLPLAWLILKEASSLKRVSLVALAFIGVFIVALAETKQQVNFTSSFFSIGVVSLLVATFLFALSDVLSKKLIATHSSWALLFYFLVGSSVLGVGPALMAWEPLGLKELLVLSLLASSGILLLLAVLKAMEAYDLAATAPFKYLELPIAIFWGKVLFHEQINWLILLGCALIITSALWLGRIEHKAQAARLAVKDYN